MPDPEPRVRLSPEELAELVARRLAEGRVQTKRLSVGTRSLAGLVVPNRLVLVSSVVLMLGTLAGLIWVIGGPEETLAGRVSDRPAPVVAGSAAEPTTSTIAVEVGGLSFTSDVFSAGIETITEPDGLFPAFPPPLTIPSSPGSITIDGSPPTSPSVETPHPTPAAPTTSSPTNTTTSGVTTSSTTGNTVTTATTTATTTTSPGSTTTSAPPTTTTTVPATTTTSSAATTTTTCRGGQGTGNPNCP